jgi:glycosyltransferase involved in cell wall biosynthesis
MTVVERMLSKITTMAIAISEYSRDFLVNEKGMDPSRVVTIPNGIPLKIFHDAHHDEGLALKKRLGLSLSNRVIGAVGMLHENKGHKLFIDAAAKVLDCNDDVVFIIVGEGEMRAELEHYIRLRQLQSKVTLIGQQSDMPAVLQMLDIFVICSYTENAPLSLLEAMSSKNAIVTTDCGGPSEIIQSGKNGYVVPVGDSAAIADAIIKLLNEPQLAEQLGRQAKLDSKQYDISRVARGIEDVYDNVVG